MKLRTLPLFILKFIAKIKAFSTGIVEYEGSFRCDDWISYDLIKFHRNSKHCKRNSKRAQPRTQLWLFEFRKVTHARGTLRVLSLFVCDFICGKMLLLATYLVSIVLVTSNLNWWSGLKSESFHCPLLERYCTSTLPHPPLILISQWGLHYKLFGMGTHLLLH